jgi:hypothetical protein
VRIFWILIFLLVLAIPVLIAGAVVAAIERQPLVAVAGTPTPAEVARVRRLARFYDPRRFPSNTTRVVTMSERDLGLVVNHAVRLLGSGGATTNVEANRAHVKATARLPNNPLGQYVNVDMALRGADPSAGALPRFEHLRIGRLSVPAWGADWLVDVLVGWLFRADGQETPQDILQSVVMTPDAVVVTYRWREEALRRLKAQLVPEADRQRLRHYHEVLAGWAKRQPSTRVSFIDFTKALLNEAEKRSDGGDPIAENRAAILTLASYVNGRSFKTLVDEAESWPRIRRLSVRLHGRRDFSQHFLGSAGLAIVGGGAISDALGLFKEVDDSVGGSGFSFQDLAADLTGSRFGQTATASETDARLMQRRVRLAKGNADLMPIVRDLPENLSDGEFRRRYTKVDSPAYLEVTRDIENRIARTALFQGL